MTAMNEVEHSLYCRISEFSIDDGNEDLTFTRRLARENGWTQAYTDRVVVEYKRFAFLGVVANHPVTPSDQVDQAWHLHLTYTKSYWDKFCGQVLETPFHHGPTRGGTDEACKFERWYQNTLESYSRFFGHKPPKDIWPDASIRFGQDLHFQRTNTKRHWIISKPPFMGAARRIVVAVLLLVILFTTALTFRSILGGGSLWWSSTESTGIQSFGAQADHQFNTLVLAQMSDWLVFISIYAIGGLL